MCIENDITRAHIVVHVVDSVALVFQEVTGSRQALDPFWTESNPLLKVKKSCFVPRWRQNSRNNTQDSLAQILNHIFYVRTSFRHRLPFHEHDAGYLNDDVEKRSGRAI